MQRLCIAFVTATALGACVKQLPAAPTPPAVVPALRSSPPPTAGQGELVIDVVEGPAPVQQVLITSSPVDRGQGLVTQALAEVPQVLCPHAPCLAQLPVGNVLLGFPVIGNDDTTEVELVHVGPEPSVYRRSLSVYEDKTGATRVLGIIATALGGSAAITGTVLLPVGLSKENDTLTAAGGITLGAGALLLAVGIWAIRHDAPTFRPGSSNHFPLTAP